jgi:hypothetical protein
MSSPKTLFILKLREDYNDCASYYQRGVATGMLNSATFVSDMLVAAGIESKVVVVQDNNSIDKEVYNYKPTHVFIEGYWVLPEKFDILKKLHPKVNWVVRCHSELPFLAQEGIAIDWTFEYWNRNIAVSGNSPRINSELQLLASQYGITDLDTLVPYLPNYYPISDGKADPTLSEDTIDIGCFGAIRPLKNQLSQAIAAISFAEKIDAKLNFHINLGRNELLGANVLKNLRALFKNLDQHLLIEHDWCDHEKFLEIIGAMDVNMQVSFTETFNIVSADSIDAGVPVVGSREIPWLQGPFADPTSVDSMVEALFEAFTHPGRYVNRARKSLKEYSKHTKLVWLTFLIKDAPLMHQATFWERVKAFASKVVTEVEDEIETLTDDFIK